MANITTYLANKLLDHSWGVTAYAKPTTYLALYTVAPTAAGGGTEVAGGSYARVALAGLIGAAGSEANDNTSDINFPTATADWGTVVAIGSVDAASGVANVLWYGNLAQQKTIGSGDSFKIPAGNLQSALA